MQASRPMCRSPRSRPAPPAVRTSPSPGTSGNGCGPEREQGCRRLASSGPDGSAQAQMAQHRAGPGVGHIQRRVRNEATAAQLGGDHRHALSLARGGQRARPPPWPPRRSRSAPAKASAKSLPLPPPSDRRRKHRSTGRYSDRRAAGVQVQRCPAARQQQCLHVMRELRGGTAVRVAPGTPGSCWAPSTGEVRRAACTAGRFSAGSTISLPASRAGSSARSRRRSTIWPSYSSPCTPPSAALSGRPHRRGRQSRTGMTP